MIDSPMRNRIVAFYGDGALKRSALNIRGGAGVFERVLSGKGYRTALEIGTYKGVAAAEMSLYVERVVTIDLLHGRLEQVGEKFDRRAFWTSLGVGNIELRLVQNDAEKETLVNGLEFDFAFIDGAHDRWSVENDFRLTRRCGRVLFHDADDNRKRDRKQSASNFVYEFLETLPHEQLWFHDIFALWTAPC